MNELINKLKDKDYVRAFGLMLPEERKCFNEVGRNNCVVYCEYDIWSGTKCGGFEHSSTYAINSDYQPETRDIPITQQKGWLGVDFWSYPEIPSTCGFCHLHCIPSLPNFDGFECVNNHGEVIAIKIDDVSRRMSKSQKVIARFRV